jgi:NTE family protein
LSPVGKRKKRVGLALSGGAARGLAHVGVLDVLHREGIPIDMIAGTSAGAIMGAIYAARQETEKLLEFALDPSWKKWAAMGDLCLERTGFLKGHKVRDLLKAFIGDNYDISELKIPFAAVATDIDTGEEVVLDSGPVVDAVRASISLPGIFTVVKKDGRLLVDGGLTTPVPINVVKNMGADFVIAVNVNPDVTKRISKADRERIAKKKDPNLLQIAMQSLYITTYALAHNSLSGADVAIEPDLGSITSSDFKLAGKAIYRGREAAEKALPEIRRKLAEL